MNEERYLEEPEKKKSNKRKFLLLLLLLVVVVCGGIAALWLNGFFDTTPKTRLQRDQDALAGLLKGKDGEDISNILGEKIAEGMVNVSIEGNVLFEQNGKKGRLGIQNIEANRYSFTVDLILDDTGETIYQSNLIDPGYYIEYVELNKTLSAGTYSATAVFKTYSLDETEDQIGEVNTKINLEVIDGTYYTTE